ncbi:hypothetical protein QQS21_009863 [Conoideocrella luteorostrata]|uniref:P-loop containing nucleoside triphosphate hydrolase protein n=1 Tax=Conoideocrella luteorostrata TaxID=1105319 RepID=A0AAJ0CKL5_9HYPO|nr:hypothetical protein QQS21_009863 [Conoideocrella luteorostrata]
MLPAPQYLQAIDNGPSVVHATKSLDKSQLEAFTEATSRQIAVIQGPPGTGKTFTSKIILESLVDTRTRCLVAQRDTMPPIIAVAQTNHALDQLLQKYISARGPKNVARLGGRSDNNIIKDLVLGQLMYNSKRFRGRPVISLKKKLKELVTSVEELSARVVEEVDAEMLLDRGLLSVAQYESLTDGDWESNECQKNGLLDWLDEAQVHVSHKKVRRIMNGNVANGSVRDQGAMDRRDPRSRSPDVNFVPLMPKPIRPVHSDDLSRHLVKNSTNLYHIRPEDRLQVYDYLNAKFQDEKNPQSDVADVLAKYTEVCKCIHEIKVENKIEYIRSEGIEVIGCTTTGLLKYRNILRGVKPKVLLMEEAAEIREADTAAASLCLPTLEHLILIGDHQQLQPSANLHELSKDPYRINISMFERLIKIGISHKTLLQQRRMIPRLRRIVQVFYPALVDSPTISKLSQNVPGMLKPLWWFQHEWQESRGVEGTSVENFLEAKMIVTFVEYLASQQIHPSRITILTFYNGQVGLIKREIAKNPSLACLASDEKMEWSVRTVDGFQGEENDFILLSLVRGPNGKAGFLSTENRAIVALSRARLGMYIFGHKEVLLRNHRSRETWSKVIQEMDRNIGRTLPLKINGKTVHYGHPGQWRDIKHKMRLKASTGGSQSSSSTTSSSRHEAIEPDTLDSRGSPPLLDERGAFAADHDLICLSDSITVPLSQHWWDLKSLLMDMAPMIPEAPEPELPEEELLIAFSDDEATKWEAAITSPPPRDLLD